jgi:hypothetical protein
VSPEGSKVLGSSDPWGTPRDGKLLVGEPLEVKGLPWREPGWDSGLIECHCHYLRGCFPPSHTGDHGNIISGVGLPISFRDIHFTT